MAQFRKIGVLTSGGDAPGMNAAIRAVTLSAYAHGVEVVGIMKGYTGLISGELKELTPRDVANISGLSGTILYSDRCPEFKTEEGMQKAIDTCHRFGIQGLVTIGGDGTFRGALALSRQAEEEGISLWEDSSTVCATTAPAAAAETTAAAAETEAPAAEVSTIEAGKLIMSTNASFPPYEMVADDGSFEGIDVEVADAIAKKLGLELEVDDMDFDAALLAVQQNKSDIVMAGVTVTEDRKLVMNFSDSYATGVQVVIVKEGSDVTLDNLGDKMIGTQRGTTGNIYTTDDYGDDHVTAYDNGASAVQALLNGQVDCVVIDSAPAQAYVAANAGLTILDTEYVTEHYAIGVNKDNTSLLDAINGALAELTADGTIDAIVAKYITAE